MAGYTERRMVILPNGKAAWEVRQQDPHGNVEYFYFKHTLTIGELDLFSLPREYNGQVLEAREPSMDDLEPGAFGELRLV